MGNTMSKESILCAPLYSDMAAATFGLYENKDSYLPYALFAVSFDEDTMWVFSSKPYEGLGKTVDAKEWLREHNAIDLLRLPMLRHTPFISSFSLPMSSGEVTDEILQRFFAKHLPDSLQYAFCWQILRNRVFVVLYREAPLNTVPDLVKSAAEGVAIIWRDYYDAKNVNLIAPRHDINAIVEEIFGEQKDCGKKIVEYFPAMTRISSLYYESSRGKGRIAITATKNENPFVKINPEKELCFSQENGKQLRKLLEITKGDLSLLIHDGGVYGIGTMETPLFTFRITGHMEWQLNQVTNGEEVQILRFKHGDYYLPQGAELRDWYINSRTDNLSRISLGNNARKTVLDLLSEENIKAFDHGALFILMNRENAKTEVNRLCVRKRGIATEEIDLLANIGKASALCAIDGALMLDEEGNCYGLGIILDGEAKVDGTPARGARYNSTKTYLSRCCDMKIDACAIIVSQDGYIDILTTEDAECKPNCNGDERQAI